MLKLTVTQKLATCDLYPRIIGSGRDPSENFFQRLSAYLYHHPEGARPLPAEEKEPVNEVFERDAESALCFSHRFPNQVTLKRTRECNVDQIELTIRDASSCEIRNFVLGKVPSFESARVVVVLAI